MRWLSDRSILERQRPLLLRESEAPAPGIRSCPAKCLSMAQRPLKPTSVRLLATKRKSGSPPSLPSTPFSDADEKLATGQMARRDIAPKVKSFHSTPGGSSCKARSGESRSCISRARGRPFKFTRRGAISATADNRRLAPRLEMRSSSSSKLVMDGRLRRASVMCGKVASGISCCLSFTDCRTGKYLGVTSDRKMKPSPSSSTTNSDSMASLA
mmetsp:Transcript_38063/g.83591  ORF Transcript_38063/g.83591 Transcript_38063/m.83591 type:complete len:213 (-) Transcript_38063:1812-2450(-)